MQVQSEMGGWGRGGSTAPQLHSPTADGCAPGSASVLHGHSHVLTHIHTGKHARAHTHTHTDTHTHTHTHTHTYMHTCTHTHTHTHIINKYYTHTTKRHREQKTPQELFVRHGEKRQTKHFLNFLISSHS